MNFFLRTQGAMVLAALAVAVCIARGEAFADPVFNPSIPLNTNSASDAGADLHPSLAGDGQGNWVAVWRSDDTLGGSIGGDQDILVARSTSNGGSWTAPAALNSNAGGDTGADSIPTIVTDGLGTWIAVWESSDTLTGTVGNDVDILFARSTDKGNSWTAVAPLNTNATTDSGDDSNPALVTDGAGLWIAAWESNDLLDGSLAADSDILYSVSLDSGVTWSPPQALNSLAAVDVGGDGSVHLGLDANGTFLAVWESGENAGGAGTDVDIMISRSVNNGATWSAQTALNGNATVDNRNDRNPRIATDSAGHWVAVWQSEDKLGGTIGIDRDILFATSSNAGASWSFPLALNSYAAVDPGIDDRFPSIATDGNGSWVVVWESHYSMGGAIGVDFDIITSFSGDNGANWSNAAALDPSAAVDVGDDFNPVVSSDGLNWLVAWDSSDDRIGTVGTDRDIFVTPNDAVCSEIPLSGCFQPVVPNKGVLLLKDKTPDKKDRLTWKWKKGEATTFQDFGDPIGGDDYRLCVYDSSGPNSSNQLLVAALAPAGGTCGTKPCWQPKDVRGYRYKDPELSPSGVKSVVLKAGDLGKARVVVKAKGVALELPVLPLQPSVLVQLKSSNGQCWESEFIAPKKNDSSVFKSKAR
ncbi:MAG: sialidase family protein [Candidatus Binatia bacterium]